MVRVHSGGTLFTMAKICFQVEALPNGSRIHVKVKRGSIELSDEFWLRGIQ